jgi:hypothetical protein
VLLFHSVPKLTFQVKYYRLLDRRAQLQRDNQHLTGTLAVDTAGISDT